MRCLLLGSKRRSDGKGASWLKGDMHSLIHSRASVSVYEGGYERVVGLWWLLACLLLGIVWGWCCVV